MENERLALLSQQGNRQALGKLWEGLRPLLFSLAWRFYTRQGKDRCAQRGVALEDLQQETFFALWDAARGRAGQDAESLAKLARNCERAAEWSRNPPC